MADRAMLAGPPSYGATTMNGRPHMVIRTGDRVTRIYEETPTGRVTAWRCGQEMTVDVLEAISAARYGATPLLTPREVTLNRMLQGR